MNRPQKAGELHYTGLERLTSDKWQHSSLLG